MSFFCLLAGYGISASINHKKPSHKKLSLTQTQQTSSRTRVLYIIDTLEVGGTERSLLQICTHLDRSQFEPIVVSLYEGSTLQEQFESHGIEVHSVNLKGKYQFYTAWTRVRKIIQDLKPDIVHTMLFRADQVGRVAAWWMKNIVVSSFVNIPYEQINPQANSKISGWKRKTIQKVDKYTARFVAQFHAVSRTVKQGHCHVLQIPEDNVTVIPRGRNTSLFSTIIQKEKLALKNRLEITSEKQVIINVGRLTSQKGQSVLIDAMQTIAHQKPNTILLIAGEGVLRESLQRQIDSLKLNNHVRLLGQIENIPLLLSIADCFAFPSFYEGLPGAVIEAMFTGCPIVASDIPMIRELIEDGNSGILVKKGENKPLAEGILKLLDDQTIAYSYGERARTVAKSQFSIQQVVRQTESFYLDVINKYEKEPS